MRKLLFILLILSGSLRGQIVGQYYNGDGYDTHGLRFYADGSFTQTLYSCVYSQRSYGRYSVSPDGRKLQLHYDRQAAGIDTAYQVRTSWIDSGQVATISGSVVDGYNGQEVPYASIRLRHNIGRQTSDSLGRFAVPVDRGEPRMDTLVIGGWGYKNALIPVDLRQQNNISCRLWGSWDNDIKPTAKVSYIIDICDKKLLQLRRPGKKARLYYRK